MSSIEFEQVTITYRRRHAANQIAHFYRSKKMLSLIAHHMRQIFINDLGKTDSLTMVEKLRSKEREYQQKHAQFEEQRKKLELKKFQYQHNADFNELLIHIVKRDEYHRLPYDIPHFIPCLFGAFEQGLINKNQLLTITLLHDALDFFNITHDDLIPFTLYQGPFRPHHIGYWQEKHQAQLQKQNQKNTFYYALPLNEQFVDALIYEMILHHFKEPYFENLLIQIFNRKKIAPGILITNYFNFVHEDHSMDLLQELFPEGPPIIDKKTRQSLRFLIAIESLGHQMPSISIAGTKIYFIIPTIDTFNLLTKILFQKEAVKPMPVVGRFSARLIRAFDEIPCIPINAHKTPAQSQLIKLFPISKTLNTPTRPVEVHYPGIPYETKPHGYEAHYFLLAWHDLFHTWRASENEKIVLRKLRHLHDTRLNFNPRPEKAMSEAIWKLTDIDCSAGLVYHEKKADHLLKAFELYIQNMVFNFEFPQVPENFLFLYHYIQNPKYWEPLPYVGSLEDNFEDLSASTDSTFKEIFLKMYQQVKHYLQIHPQAPWMQVYWSHQLCPQTSLEDQMIQSLDERACHYLFTWPGLEIEFKETFYQKHLQPLDVHRIVLNNPGKETLYFCFLVYHLQNQKNLQAFSINDIMLFLQKIHLNFSRKLLSYVQNGDDLLKLYENCQYASPLFNQIEFLVIKSTDAFQGYLKKYRSELSSTWIETCGAWTMEQRRHVFYNEEIEEPYYLVKYPQSIPKNHLLSLSKTHPKWARRLMDLIHTQYPTPTEEQRCTSVSPCTTVDSEYSAFSQNSF